MSTQRSNANAKLGRISRIGLKMSESVVSPFDPTSKKSEPVVSPFDPAVEVFTVHCPKLISPQRVVPSDYAFFSHFPYAAPKNSGGAKIAFSSQNHIGAKAAVQIKSCFSRMAEVKYFGVVARLSPKPRPYSAYHHSPRRHAA